MRARFYAALALALITTGCKDCNPTAPDTLASGTREVWVSPNIGSRDFLDLFSNPDAWPKARSKATAIGFYAGNLVDEPCDLCGDNTLRNFLSVVPGGAFRWLTDHRLKVAIEAPSVKPWDCTAALPGTQTLAALGNVTANGGRAAFVAMDGPFVSALAPNQPFAASMDTCHFSVEQTAAVVAAYVSRIRRAYPDVAVGLIEPYPYFGAAEIESFVTALSAAGVTLSFFHLDYDQNFLSVDPTAEFLELRNFFRARQIPFGIIIIGSNGTNNELATNGALVAALRISNVLGIQTMSHVLFQSWLDYLPALPQQDLRLYPDNLPETVPTTLMGLVNVVLDSMR